MGKRPTGQTFAHEDFCPIELELTKRLPIDLFAHKKVAHETVARVDVCP